MKKTFFLTILFLCLAFPDAQAREPYAPKSEITVRWGAQDIDSWDEPGLRRRYGDWGTPLDRYNEGKYEYDDLLSTQAITVSYTSELRRWLALSINVSYIGVSQNERSTYGHAMTDKYRSHNFSIYPMVRFLYLNRPVIRMYSELGLGLGTKSGSWSSDNMNYNENYISGQVTFFGVSVGKKFFASWEIGYGNRGILAMAAGYRF